ncbi:MAG: DUF2452 domain-containing protein [Thiohalophilus sp.]|jgi:hypothetical protein
MATNDGTKKYSGELHQGSERSAPYPVSRLAPAFELVDLAKQISEADKMINTRVSSKLKVIADQIRHLQDEARQVLEETQKDQKLHQAACNFQRQPGHVYHLYRKADGNTWFSMLSPDDWQGQPPNEYLGSYRLEADMSWTDMSKLDDQEGDETRELVKRLLEGHGL